MQSSKGIEEITSRADHLIGAGAGVDFVFLDSGSDAQLKKSPRGQEISD